MQRVLLSCNEGCVCRASAVKSANAHTSCKNIKDYEKKELVAHVYNIYECASDARHACLGYMVSFVYIHIFTRYAHIYIQILHTNGSTVKITLIVCTYGARTAHKVFALGPKTGRGECCVVWLNAMYACMNVCGYCVCAHKR